jgi:peptide/nickel transport system substrate-binding protein
VEFSVLGPLEVRRDGQAVALGGPKQRALLAMLLLHPNEVVSRDRLIEGLWGERPPTTAVRSLDSHVSRLRTLVGPERIERRAPGYLVRVGPDELDLVRFETLLERGRAAAAAGDARAASEALRNALGLWRGDAIADLLYEPFAAREAERLEERRLLAIEERIDADLALGGGSELVSELERLVEQEPFRERLLGQLMLCLYRAGRSAEAVAVYQLGRQRLAEELGLEPGPQLRLLERQILGHDPALGVDRPPPRAPKRLKRVRRVWLVAAGIATAVAVSAAIGVWVSTGSSGSRIAHTSSSRLLELGSGGQPVGRGATLAGSAAAAVVSGGSLWLSEPDSGEVVRIDTVSGNVDPIPVGGQPGALAVGAGYIWVADASGLGRVIGIDPAADRATQHIPLGGAQPAALAFKNGRLWVADPTDESLLVFNPLTGELERAIKLGIHPTALAFGAGGLWVADYDADVVDEIDAHLRQPQPLVSVPVGSGPTALAVGPHAVWVANSLASTVSRINPGTGNLVATISVGSSPSALAFSGGALWVANEYSQTISRIDQIRNLAGRPLAVGGAPTALATSKGRLFVATRPLSQHRGGTLVLLHTNPITIDPALQVDLPPTVSDGLTRDDLLAHAHAGGPEGQHLVPDLALSVPTATDGGHTYMFRLRPGIRYSNGTPVRASDIRRELERLFRLGSPGSNYFADIVGNSACTQTHCDLSRGIATNDKARTITFHLIAPSVDFLSNLATGGLASAVPPGTPFHNVGDEPIPGTGPYKIATANGHEIRWVRNPYFHEWSHAAQPAGNPDQIIMRFGLTAAQEARAVEQGRADYTTDPIPASSLPQIKVRYPTQLHTLPSNETDTLQLNTTLPPFNDVRVRRALNLAIDRTAVARLYGTSAATPTCQVLPPAVAGYVRFCPWTRDPRPDGRWRGPNLTRARALIRASGTRGESVTVWGPSDAPPLGPDVVSYVVKLLRRLGFRARSHLIPFRAFGSIPQRVFEHRIQITPPGWGDSTPDGFFSIWFRCSASFNHHWFCSTHLDREIRRAEALETTNPTAAIPAWAHIDHVITNQAAWVPLVNPTVPDFVSARVRNYQSSPEGPVVDQFWLR